MEEKKLYIVKLKKGGRYFPRHGALVSHALIQANDENHAHELAKQEAGRYGADSYELELDDNLNNPCDHKVRCFLRLYKDGKQIGKWSGEEDREQALKIAKQKVAQHGADDWELRMIGGRSTEDDEMLILRSW